MKSKSKRSKLRIESLEKRVMLDGNLAVSVIGGTLVIAGDAKPNVAIISPAPGGTTGGAAGSSDSFVISPDQTTSINGDQPGVPLVVSGVTAGGRIDLGGGDDSLTLQGPGDLAGPLSVQTGSGSDRVSVSDFHFTRLSVSSSQGDDSVDISNTSVDAAVTLQAQQGQGSATLTNDSVGLPTSSGTPLTPVSLSSTNFGLSLRGTRTGKSVTALFDQRGGTVSVAETSTIGGGLSVTSKGPLDFSMTQSACVFDTFLKLDSSAAKGPPNIVLQQSRVGGDLTISSKGPENVLLDEVRTASARIKLTSASVRSGVTVRDFDCDGRLDVACTGPTDFSASSARAADMFLKLDGIKGEVVVDNTSLDDVTLSGGLVVTGSAAQKISANKIKFDFHVVKLSNANIRSSVALSDLDGDGRLDVACAGPVDFSASSVRASDMFLKLDGIKGERVVDNTSLDNITLSGGLVVTGSAAQNLKFNTIKVDFHAVKLSNTSDRSSVTVVDEDCDGKLDVACAGPADFSASSVRASDIFLKLDDIKGERVVGNTSLDNITLGGGLVVTGSAAQNLSHHKIKLDFHTIKLTNANIRSSVTIVDEDCDGRLDVSCAGPVDFSASSLAATDMFLKLDNVRGLSTGSNASLRELILFGGLSVTARDAAKMTITGVACDRYTIKLTNASLAGASVATDEDIACGDQISVSCTGPVDYSASSVRASDMFLKFDGIKGASFVDNTSLDRVTLSGGLFVSSRVVHKMSLDDIKGERIYLKLDAASAQGRSSVSLADVDLDGPVDVVCRGAVDFSAGGGGSSGLSSHAVDMHLKFESLATQTTPSSVTLRDWSLDGVLDIVSRGALNLSVGGATTNPDGSVSPGGGLRAVDMFLKIGDVKRAPESSKMSLTDLVLSGDLQVVMGGGDDSLSVSTSTVAGIAIFDGGKGNDNLVISGSAFGFEPVQISCAPV